MVRLMNSAMMPQPGCYWLEEITPDEFGCRVRCAHEDGLLRSYIGYPQTAALIVRLSNDTPIPVSREATQLDDGDTLLICRLRYRIADPKTKADQQPEDFQFFRCIYRGTASSPTVYWSAQVRGELDDMAIWGPPDRGGGDEG